MNIKLLRKIKQHILKNPKRLFMSAWVMRKESDGSKLTKYDASGDAVGERGFASCGTAACIAGWAVLLTGRKFTDSGEAAHLLGIYGNQYRLFATDQWPEPFRSKYKDDGSKRSARIAADRIEYFIRTKGKE